MADGDFAKYYYLENYLFGEVSERFRREQSLPAFDFFCIVIWKANRAKSKIATRLLAHGHDDLDSAVGDLLRQVSDVNDAKARLGILVNGWGFRLPMASAILTVLYPEEFTVYDVRVCDVLGDFKDAQYKANPDVLWDRYSRYVDRVRTEVPAKPNLREKDRFLWGKSFESQLRGDVARCFKESTEPTEVQE